MIGSAGSTDRSAYFYIVQDNDGTAPGEPIAGLIHSDLDSASYVRQGGARVAITPITLASADAAHAAGGFIEVDAVNSKGLYRLDLPDAAYASGVDQVFASITIAAIENAIATPIAIDLFPANFHSLVISPAGAIDALLQGILDGTLTESLENIMVTNLDVFLENAGLVSTRKISDVGVTDTGVKAIWDRILTGATHNINNSAGKLLRQVGGATVFTGGTAQGGAANSLQLASGDVTVDGQYQRAKVIIVAGAGIHQEALITSSVASTDTVIITPEWLVTPDNTSEYEVLPAQLHTTTQDGGYTGGMVYVDTIGGVAGTQIGVNGVDTNPVDNLPDAYAIAAAKNLTHFRMLAGSALVLPSDSTGMTFEGEGYTVDLNGQEVGSIKIIGGVSVTGTGLNTSGGQKPFFEGCGVGSVTLPPFITNICGFFGTVTIGTAGDFTFGNSTSVFDSTLTIDYGVANNASSVFVTGWTGGSIEMQNAGAGTGAYKFDMTGTGDLTVNANCSADTTVKLGGQVSRNADVAGIVYSEDENLVAAFREVKGPTFDPNTDSLEASRDNIGTAGVNLGNLGGMSAGMEAEVNAAVDTALVDYDGPTNAQFEARTPTAAQLDYIVKNAATAVPITFTTAGGTTTNAVFNQVDGAAPDPTNDQYKHKVIYFDNGAIASVESYVGGTTSATISTLPFAPSASTPGRLV